MADNNKKPLHPCQTVSNIKAFIPIILDIEKDVYSTWAELFKVHARAYRVLHHIIPQTTTDSTTTEDKDKWNDVDATVLTWIYGTISLDLITTIISPNLTAMEAWDRLRDILQDNKHTRAVYLEDKFTHTDLSNFPNATAYCQELKSLSDQLASVGSPISPQRLVLQLIKGLSSAYGNLATVLEQSDPLPTFY